MTSQILRVLGATALCAVLGACDSPQAPRDLEQRAWKIDDAHSFDLADRYEVTVEGAPATVHVAEVDATIAVVIAEADQDPMFWGYSENGLTVLVDPQTGQPFELDPADPYHDLAITALSDSGLPTPRDFRATALPFPGGSGLPTYDPAACYRACSDQLQMCEWLNWFRIWLNRDGLIYPCDLDYQICIDAC